MRRAALFLIFALTLTTLACNLASPQATFAPPPDPSPSGQAVPPAGTDNATATASSPAGADPTPTLELAQRLRGYGVGNLVVTRGGDGALILTEALLEKMREE